MKELGADRYIQTARSLAPLVDELRERFDQERDVPGELVDALRAGGLFGMWLPRALGGPELDPLSFLTVIEELSRLDGTVGWCTVIPAGYSRLAAGLDETVAREIFGSGRSVLVGTLNPTGKAVAVEGGYLVSGTWGYGSFINHSQWVLGNCVTHVDGSPKLTDESGPELRLAIFPSEDVEVIDVWHVGGLRGTGSNDYRVTGLFVPEERTIPLPGFSPVPRQPGPLYVVPMTSTFVACIATVALGIARAAIEALDEIAGSKTPMGSQAVLRERAIPQANRARAEALVRAGRAYLFEEIERVWLNAVAGRPIATQSRANVRLAACHATTSAIEAVDLVYALGGGSSLFETNRLQRCFRDIHAAGAHVAVAPIANLEPVGRVLFGLDPGLTRF
jgi:indole-3-acetate monooxygenase